MSLGLVMSDLGELVAGLEVCGCLGTSQHGPIPFVLGKKKDASGSLVRPVCAVLHRVNFPRLGESRRESGWEE